MSASAPLAVSRPLTRFCGSRCGCSPASAWNYSKPVRTACQIGATSAPARTSISSPAVSAVHGRPAVVLRRGAWKIEIDFDATRSVENTCLCGLTFSSREFALALRVVCGSAAIPKEKKRNPPEPQSKKEKNTHPPPRNPAPGKIAAAVRPSPGGRPSGGAGQAGTLAEQQSSVPAATGPPARPSAASPGPPAPGALPRSRGPGGRDSGRLVRAGATCWPR